MCAGGLGGHRGPPPTTTSTSPALNSLLHLTPNICLLLWRPPSTCRRSFHTCHKFFSRGDKLYDAATLLLSCASICAAPPLTRETRLAAFVILNIADLSAGEAAAHYCGCSSFIYFQTHMNTMNVAKFQTLKKKIDGKMFEAHVLGRCMAASMLIFSLAKNKLKCSFKPDEAPQIKVAQVQVCILSCQQNTHSKKNSLTLL